MSDRIYRLILGAVLVVCLYFDLHEVLIAVIVVEAVEGLTNWRIPLLVSRAVSGPAGLESLPEGGATVPFDAERAWRLTVAVSLALSYLVFHEQLWWFAWFMGFAIFGAGLSGVCPMLISFKLLGFR